jgi:Tol biopolymer transport system component
VVAGNNGLNAVSPGGSPDATVKVGLQGSLRDISWSPNGRELAYTGAEGSGVWIADTVDGTTRSLGPCLAVSAGCSIAWSPDGQLVAAAAVDGLVLISVADGEAIEVPLPAGVHVADPAWSPDGEWIALGFEHTQGAKGLAKVRPDGSEFVILIDSVNDVGRLDPVWSPIADQITYLDYGAPRTYALSLSVVGTDGSQPTKLVDVAQCPCPMFLSGLAMSPDGTQLAMTAPNDVSGGLRIMNADGTGGRSLLSGVVGGEVAWQPVPGPSAG